MEILKTREERVEAGGGAWREEQGWRGVDRDHVAVSQRPSGSAIQEALGNEAGSVCNQSQTLRRLRRRNRMVLVSIGALGCKQSNWLGLTSAKRKVLKRFLEDPSRDVTRKVSWRQGKLVSCDRGQNHAAGTAREDSQGC